MPTLDRAPAPAVPFLLALALAGLAGCGGPVRVELEPASLKLFGRGQAATLHATPRLAGGQPDQSAVCAWSSSDPAVATVAGAHNSATVTSVAPGTATITCAVGQVRASVTAAVRAVARVAAGPSPAALQLADERRPLLLQVAVFDDQGAPVAGRLVFTRCDDEAVCRGDARGQLWATGEGRTSATVTVEGVSTTLPVVVTDVRTEATRPQVLKRGYMEDLERQVRRREAAEAAAAARAAEAR
ncbi:MAG: Ig-like domain-containing protein [Anaeromyxobacter sp.]|nr:Ig-like domain-containing protein [Anaeromyxobacter sp.]MBL0277441.1 Ig-like domain-containing protein [Anaeromyxobacter sp.]